MQVCIYLLSKQKKWHRKMEEFTVNLQDRFLRQKESTEFLSARQGSPPFLLWHTCPRVSSGFSHAHKNQALERSHCSSAPSGFISSTLRPTEFKWLAQTTWLVREEDKNLGLLPTASLWPLFQTLCCSRFHAPSQTSQLDCLIHSAKMLTWQHAKSREKGKFSLLRNVRPSSFRGLGSEWRSRSKVRMNR